MSHQIQTEGDKSMQSCEIQGIFRDIIRCNVGHLAVFMRHNTCKKGQIKNLRDNM